MGKIGVPDAVLLKPGPLTLGEFAPMKRHPEIGNSLCAPLQSLPRVRPIVLCHHERLDGSGYPSGRRGDEVPVLAHIVGIVDVFDALTSARPVSSRADIRGRLQVLGASSAGRQILAPVRRGVFEHAWQLGDGPRVMRR